MSGQPFANVYEDDARAAAYAALEFPGTYWLAYRDLPAVFAAHVTGSRALDFGCGTGRSTRFLKQHGFDAVGIDISAQMVQLATARDPGGRYLRIADGDFSAFEPGSFDLILSAFAFDNIPGPARRAALLGGLRALLAPGGRLVLLGSRPEIYWHEWASFTTRAFPENRQAGSGERVRIVMKDVPDDRPVDDTIWFPADYAALFDAAGLALLAQHHPLGQPDDGQEWLSETRISPWVIYVLGVVDGSGR